MPQEMCCFCFSFFSLHTEIPSHPLQRCYFCSVVHCMRLPV
ncbi:hypothetical protein FORC31_0101 [Escherichia coli]|nr:hypothetical protein FORC31_0101 [Escherichia coli]